MSDSTAHRNDDAPEDPRSQEHHVVHETSAFAYASAALIGGAFEIFPPLMHVVHTRTRRRTPSGVMIFTV